MKKKITIAIVITLASITIICFFIIRNRQQLKICRDIKSMKINSNSKLFDSERSKLDEINYQAKKCDSSTLNYKELLLEKKQIISSASYEKLSKISISNIKNFKKSLAKNKVVISDIFMDVGKDIEAGTYIVTFNGKAVDICNRNIFIPGEAIKANCKETYSLDEINSKLPSLQLNNGEKYKFNFIDNFDSNAKLTFTPFIEKKQQGIASIEIIKKYSSTVETISVVSENNYKCALDNQETECNELRFFDELETSLVNEIYK